ncbi:MAG: dephospho-CoA kinase [Alphaproteobacteria bacterium]|nr:dephospho-CoA kinase [Alphaproteobacteria bacterium]
MITLGLTGSIGMGKSVATRTFRELGAVIFDADAEVHKLLASGGGAVAAVLAAFPDCGRAGPEGAAIDRAALGHVVFRGGPGLERLEAILHPLVRRAEERTKGLARRRRAWLVVCDIPLLFETGGQSRYDAVAVVDAPAFVQRTRVLRRPGMTAARLADILGRQMPSRVKRRRADFVIPTGLGRRTSLLAVRRIARRLRQKGT